MIRGTEGSPYDAKPRRTGAWVRAETPNYRDGWYQVWFYTANPHRYETEDMYEIPLHVASEDV